MSVLRLDDVLAEVMKRPADSGLRMIGVDDPSGSGKSTLAAQNSARIGAPLDKMDDFVSWVDLVGWWPRFEAQVLVGRKADVALRRTQRVYINSS
jgi:hypothetical protein